jgi:hypothetical protein
MTNDVLNGAMQEIHDKDAAQKAQDTAKRDDLQMPARDFLLSIISAMMEKGTDNAELVFPIGEPPKTAYVALRLSLAGLKMPPELPVAENDEAPPAGESE